MMGIWEFFLFLPPKFSEGFLSFKGLSLRISGGHRQKFFVEKGPQNCHQSEPLKFRHKKLHKKNVKLSE